MERAILISIRPEWVKKILTGEKISEIRKSIPKYESSIRVFIYCTQGKPNLYIPQEFNAFELDDSSKPYFAKKPILEECDYLANGKVVAEFTLKSHNKFDYDGLRFFDMKDIILEHSCLTDEQLCNYIQDGIGYAWHIKKLIVYDKPKELHEFGVYDVRWSKARKCEMPGWFPLKRPPQSWCYVEK